MRRASWTGLGATVLLTGMSHGQAFCPKHPGNPVLLTPGSATCSFNQTTGDTVISMVGESIIEWDRFNVPLGSTTQFDFVGNPTNPSVVNVVTGTRTNFIDGSLQANGRFALISPSAQTTVRGTITTESFLGVALEPDDLGEILSGEATSFGSSGGDGEWITLRDGGSITATGGDIVLGGDNLVVGSGSQLLASAGSVRMVRASQFALGNTGAERISVGGAPGTGETVLVTGEVSGDQVEIKSTGNIHNNGTIEAGGGFGQIYLRVGANGTIFNEGSGTLSGVLYVTGEFDNVGVLVEAKDQDAAVALASSMSDLPEIEDPRGKRTAGRERRQLGGAAGSVAVQRQEKTGRQNVNVASGKRKVLNRKSAFFGLVGRGAGKKKE